MKRLAETPAKESPARRRSGPRGKAPAGETWRTTSRQRSKGASSTPSNAETESGSLSSKARRRRVAQGIRRHDQVDQWRAPGRARAPRPPRPCASPPDSPSRRSANSSRSAARFGQRAAIGELLPGALGASALLRTRPPASADEPGPGRLQVLVELAAPGARRPCLQPRASRRLGEQGIPGGARAGTDRPTEDLVEAARARPRRALTSSGVGLVCHVGQVVGLVGDHVLVRFG